MTDKSSNRFRRQLDRLESRTPNWIRVALHVLRHPWALVIRVPLGILFVIGGLLSILPVLGLWMLPLGVLLLAIDLPFLQGPTGGSIVRFRRWWENRRRARRMR